MSPLHAAQSPVAVPTLANVVQWLGVVVNAHLVALALLPGAREVRFGALHAALLGHIPCASVGVVDLACRAWHSFAAALAGRAVDSRLMLTGFHDC